MEDTDVTRQLAKEFQECRKVLTAIGDENRLHLIIEMMQMKRCGGVRVGEITARTHLSRPAVSHHLQILKEAGILGVRKEGTKNYYYFDSDQRPMKQLAQTLQTAVQIAAELADRGQEEE